MRSPASGSRLLARIATLLVVGLLASGCVVSPPTSGSPDPVPALADAEDDQDIVHRAARAGTLRVRNRTCFGVGSGSGFALTNNTLVTNHHVIAGASEIQLSTWDGRSLTTDLIAAATYGDLALVRVSDRLETVLPIGHDPDDGAQVTVYGYPGGRAITAEPATVIDAVPGSTFHHPGHVLRLDALIEQGNSGGPVLNHDGEVVAVVFAIETATGHGLAVPASLLQRALSHRDFVPMPPLC